MMYLDDAIRGTIELMAADADKISVRTSYNFAAVSFSPEQLAAEVAKLSPGFQMKYEPDFRQQIAESWPKTIDDSQAREDWGWTHVYGLEEMAQELYEKIKQKLASQ